MNINRKTTFSEEGKLANTKESKMKITSSKVIRWSGLAAMGAGIIFIAIQPIHPPDVVASVTTGAWALVTTLKFAMSALGLLGVAGIYARQVEESGWLGLAGFFMLSAFYALTLIFAFIEAFVAPVLAAEAPNYVGRVVGLAFGNGGTNLGAVPAFYMLQGFMFMLGGLVLGIATLRARVLPRWAGTLLAFGAISPPLLSLVIPHPYNRMLAAPISLALIWLGYALLTERRAPATQPEPSPCLEIPQLSQTGAG